MWNERESGVQGWCRHDLLKTELLPFTEMGRPGEERHKFHLGLDKLKIPRWRYQFLKAESTSGKIFHPPTWSKPREPQDSLTNKAGPRPSLVSDKQASHGFLLQGPGATQGPHIRPRPTLFSQRSLFSPFKAIYLTTLSHCHTGPQSQPVWSEVSGGEVPLVQRSLWALTIHREGKGGK